MDNKMLKKREMDNKYDPTDLFLGRYDYDNWFENQKSTDITKGCEEESADTTKGGEKNLLIYHPCHHKKVQKKE